MTTPDKNPDNCNECGNAVTVIDHRTVGGVNTAALRASPWTAMPITGSTLTATSATPKTSTNL